VLMSRAPSKARFNHCIRRCGRHIDASAGGDGVTEIVKYQDTPKGAQSCDNCVQLASSRRHYLAALADTLHLIQHLIVLLHIRFECFRVKATTTSSGSANSASSRRG
jgi:hypothetical protein